MIQGTAVPLVFHDAVGRDCTQCYIFLKKSCLEKFFILIELIYSLKHAKCYLHNIVTELQALRLDTEWLRFGILLFLFTFLSIFEPHDFINTVDTYMKIFKAEKNNHVV